MSKYAIDRLIDQSSSYCNISIQFQSQLGYLRTMCLLSHKRCGAAANRFNTSLCCVVLCWWIVANEQQQFVSSDANDIGSIIYIPRYIQDIVVAAGIRLMD